eukprot:TRINITY_DN14216_c0_g1_i2.p1 TRINITY_DN14216_c0_g1~~TRINITY_DN14216_c0_g1_i2.p1  ORF type:complete len:161 (+),score=31.31 TRINITY_DN14216_c0_g1_i2:17-499(+)
MIHQGGDFASQFKRRRDSSDEEVEESHSPKQGEQQHTPEESLNNLPKSQQSYHKKQQKQDFHPNQHSTHSNYNFITEKDIYHSDEENKVLDNRQNKSREGGGVVITRNPGNQGTSHQYNKKPHYKDHDEPINQENSQRPKGNWKKQDRQRGKVAIAYVAK